MHHDEVQNPSLDLCLIPPTIELRSGVGDGKTCACASSVVTIAMRHDFTDRDPTISDVIRRLVFQHNDYNAWWGQTEQEQIAERTRVLMPRGEDGCVRPDAFIARIAFTAASPEVEGWRLCVALHRSLCVWLPEGLDRAANACDVNKLDERAVQLREHAATLRAFPIERLRADRADLADRTPCSPDASKLDKCFRISFSSSATSRLPRRTRRRRTRRRRRRAGHHRRCDGAARDRPGAALHHRR